MRDRIEVALTAANAERLLTQPVQYDTGFTVLPGQYVLKFLVRDAEVGRIGTYQTSFTIPNLNREPARLPISSVVLGSQRLTVTKRCTREDDRRQASGARSSRAGSCCQRDAHLQRVARIMHLPEAYEQYQS
jgi:hypothetical protein